MNIRDFYPGVELSENLEELFILANFSGEEFVEELYRLKNIQNLKQEIGEKN